LSYITGEHKETAAKEEKESKQKAPEPAPVETAVEKTPQDKSKKDEEDFTPKPLPAGFARPVVMHRAIFGSFERFIGILIEHFAGKVRTRSRHLRTLKSDAPT
jgi:threonyl-tRNA synthetase